MVVGFLRRSSKWLWLSCGLLLLIFISYGLRSSSTYSDDSIQHFLIARWSLKHPELLLDVWGRPGFTILYALISQFGLTAVHMQSAVLAALICGLAAYLAAEFAVEWYWLAAIFTGIQPEFARLSFAALTELPCAAYLAAALLAQRRQRWTFMALFAGLIPLARYETLPLLIFFAFSLVKERRYWQLGLMSLPMLIWNGFWALRLNDWTNLLFPLDRVLFEKGGSVAFYGTGPWWHYITRLPVAFGSVPFALAVYGFLRMRWNSLHSWTVGYIAILAISYWKIPATQIAGYDRHLAILAPIIGTFSAYGLHTLRQPITKIWQGWGIRGALGLVMMGLLGMAWVRWITRGIVLYDALLSVGLVALLLLPRLKTAWYQRLVGASVVIGLLGLFIRVQPFIIQNSDQQVLNSTQWFKQSDYRQQLVLAAIPWFAYGTGIDPYDPAQYQPITPNAVAQAPVGSIVVWDSRFAWTLQWQTPRSLLENPARFRLLKQYHGVNSNGNPLELAIYQKIN